MKLSVTQAATLLNVSRATLYNNGYGEMNQDERNAYLRLEADKMEIDGRQMIAQAVAIKAVLDVVVQQ